MAEYAFWISPQHNVHWHLDQRPRRSTERHGRREPPPRLEDYNGERDRILAEAGRPPGEQGSIRICSRPLN